MNKKNFDINEKITLNDLNESRNNNRLSLRKKNFDKIMHNKRKLIYEIEMLFPQDTSKESSNNLPNNNLLKILSNEQIYIIFNQMKGKLILDNLTELFQCLFSLDYNIDQYLLETIAFINNNKIYIFLVDLLEQFVNSNNINNSSQLIYKILQIIFKLSSNIDSNKMFKEYINDKISIFNKIFTNIENKKIVQNKTGILLYSANILYNLSLETNNFINNLYENKIQEKMISIILNSKNHNLNLNEKNIFYIINFFSLDLLDKNFKNFNENYIQNIFNLLNEKGITSSSSRVQELSLDCLCNITFYFKSEKFYKNIMYSGIFNNIFKFIKKSQNLNSINVALKIVNNILTEKNIDLNYFIKTDLLLGLMQLIINYETNKSNITPDLLHHIICIFLYLDKSPLFYSLIDKNRAFMNNIIYLIGKISNEVTHDILTFIKNVINESYKISQLLILNNLDLISNLICLVRDECHNDKIRIMALIILGKIIGYNHENMNDEENNIIINYENQLKEIIELNLLNKDNINETLKKTFIIILNMINDE